MNQIQKKDGVPVRAGDSKDVLEQSVSGYRDGIERKARTYKSEAHRDEEKGDGVRCFSHRGSSLKRYARVISPPHSLAHVHLICT